MLLMTATFAYHYWIILLRLSTDQMEEWTTAEAALFEEAMEKHGKTFNDIWTDYLPWKTVKVEICIC